MAGQGMEYLRLLRPHQWSKNGFVLVGPLFGHGWGDPQLVLAALLAMAAFILVSGAAYVLNDWHDRVQDRHHPDKRWRPLASGRITTRGALLLAGACALGGLGLGWLVSTAAAAFMGSYLLLNLAYSGGLKEVPILDVFLISAGFLLRILVGTLGLGIAPSGWLLLTALMLTLFLGFAKRRAELHRLGKDAPPSRLVLAAYSLPLLDSLLGITAACLFMAYGLYTMSPDTMAFHHTRYLIVTLPLVMYGVFRALFLLHHGRLGEDPAAELLGDRQMAATLLLWLLLTVRLIS